MINLVERKSKTEPIIEIKENDQIVGQFINCRIEQGKEPGSIAIMRDDIVCATFATALALINGRKRTD